jgi:hypothetical protein
MSPRKIWIRKQYIASSNREWTWRTLYAGCGTGRGATPADCIAHLQRRVDLSLGATIIIEPDDGKS